MRSVLLSFFMFVCCLTTFSQKQQATTKTDTESSKFSGNQDDIDAILKASKNFSGYYINADYDNLVNSYTIDGKIFPDGTPIIEGKEAIRKRWVLPEGTKILKHVATPSEIKVIGDYAYDFGYYEGETKRKDGSISSWKGKYVIVWKKEVAGWKIYLDIWNSVQN